MQNAESSLTWLHISDTHFGSPDEVAWRDAALRALLDTLEVEGNKGWRPDFIFFTGDLAFWGRLSDYHDAQTFFDQLLDKTGLKHLKEERLFVVPGNHDVDRKETAKIFLPPDDQAHDDWIAKFVTISEMENFETASDNFFRNELIMRAFLGKFHDFQQFLNDYLGRAFSTGKPYLVSLVDNVKGFRVGVIGFNTAWLAGDREKEYRQLLGQLPLELALQELNKTGEVDLTFAMLHHPLEDLHEHERTQIKDRLRADFDFVLCGHLDCPQLAEAERSGDKTVPFFRVGPTYGGHHFPNRFYLARYYIERNKKWISLNPFRYSKMATSWLPDVEVLAKLKKFYGSETLEVGTAAPLLAKLPFRWVDKQSPLSPITLDVLKREEREAKKDLQELERLRVSFGPGSREYGEYCNSRSFIGHLPEWRHLYMSTFGAFRRPKKEAELLMAFAENIHNLEARANGLLLHVISGDSGSGKSTLAKIIIRRLCEKDELDKIPHLLDVQSRLLLFEIAKTGDWDAIGDVLTAGGRSSADIQDPIFLLFFDDLFAELDRDHIQRLFEILSRAAEITRIYLLVTSPSWLFSRRELQMYRHDFGLVDSLETPIRGLDTEDRDSLKAQYQAMYQDKCRADLVKVIEDEQDVVLIKLALHQNLHYSDYLKRLFRALQYGGLRRYLAALLLSSTLARFYVHCPLTLIKEMNRDFSLKPEEKLPELASDYEGFAVQGFKLFRIREGTRGQSGAIGLPDTIAPLHDRIAQVIYSAWGSDDVPVFGLKLWELSSRIYESLNKTAETKPVLANIFRGMLRSSQVEDQELGGFVKYFGPLQQGRWALLNHPEASYRWITYSKYRPGQTEGLRRAWSHVLHSTTPGQPVERAKLGLLCSLLNPRDWTYSKDVAWTKSVSDLEEEYFPLISGVLNELLGLQPGGVDFLTDYLETLEEWLNKYPRSSHSGFSHRYSVMRSLVGANLRLPGQDELNCAVRPIVKNYLRHIAIEFKSYYVLGAGLIRDIRWSDVDSKELSEHFLQYTSVEGHWYRPVVFELLLNVVEPESLERPTAIDLFRLYVNISLQLPEFSGLSFTSQRFFEWLERLRDVNTQEYEGLLKYIRDSFLVEHLEGFATTKAYPDFVHMFLEHLGRRELAARQLMSLLRPLVKYHGDSSATKYAFRTAQSLVGPGFCALVAEAKEQADRQIRLCFAERVGLPLEVLLRDFTELLEGKVSVPDIVCSSLSNYLRRKKKGEISAGVVEECQKQICMWLRQNTNKKAIPVFLLMGSGILFSPQHMKGCEDLACLTFQEVSEWEVAPLLKRYCDWWLRSEAMEVSEEQRRAVLAAFWGFILKHSGRRKAESYVVYDLYFSILLEKYGIKTDEVWWGRAVHLLVEFYAGSLVTKGRGKTAKRKSIEYQRSMAYEQRKCLGLIMDTLLKSYHLLESELHGEFKEAVEKALMPYQNQQWAANWLSKLRSASIGDLTELFLSSLKSIGSQLSLFCGFELEEQFEWWHEGLKVSGHESLHKGLTRVWQWLDQDEHLNITVYLVGPLLKAFGESVRRFDWGKLVNRVLRSRAADFYHKVTLLCDYADWFEENDWEIFEGLVFRVEAQQTVRRVVTELEAGTISGELRTVFSDAEFPLSAGASVTQVEGNEWLITSDGDGFMIRHKSTLDAYFGGHDKEVPERQVGQLQDMLNWFVQESAKMRNLELVLRGLKALLRSAPKYGLDFQVTQIKPLFFKTLGAFIEEKEGEELANLYFRWMIDQKGDSQIDEYLNWVTLHWEGKQTPSVLAHLLSSVLDSSEALFRSFDQLEQIWSAMKLLISKRLDSKGTTNAVENFGRCIVYFQDTLPIGDKTLINKLSEEFYHLVLHLSDHPNVAYLFVNMPVFKEGLLEVPDRPSPREILSLSHKLRLSLSNYLDPDSYITLTRTIDNCLSPDAEAREIFRQDLLGHIEEKPDHRLSPRLAGIILADDAYLTEYPSAVQRISAVLPDLVRLQADLQEVAYPLGQCLRHLSLVMLTREERMQYESSLMDLLELNFQKPHSEICLLQVITYCTRQVHYDQLARLVKSSLREALRGMKRVQTSTNILKTYHQYIEGCESGDMKEALHRDASRSLLKVVLANAQEPRILHFFDVLLNMWREPFISEDAAVQSLRELILRQNKPAVILEVCKRFRKRYGEKPLLSSTLSIGDALRRLVDGQQEGLAELRNALGS
jgi:DNA replication protein DnaC